MSLNNRAVSHQESIRTRPPKSEATSSALQSRAVAPLFRSSKQFLAATLASFGLMTALQAQNTLPVVAVHDSEYTRALATIPATPPTPTGGNTTGFQWWHVDWRYFVMPESVKEMLRSDGTAHAVISDADIAAGKLMTNGAPRYPIMISLASEAIHNNEIAPLTNYVASGGILFVGSSSFTRNTNGTARGNFAISSQMGVTMPTATLQNWLQNTNLRVLNPHRITSHIPAFSKLEWRLPEWSEETPWRTSPDHDYHDTHDIWLADVTDATAVAYGDEELMLAVKPYGKGYFIYFAPFQPLIGNGGWSPGMYSYGLFRNAIEWAFENLKVPVAKLSPWPYEYDAAFTIRHDLENFQFEISNIESSAGYEFTNGVKGDYYFCTGTLREEIPNPIPAIAGLRSAVTNYGATIGSHNGGLANPVNLSLDVPDYDYWHWGPDEALDVTPSGYPNGKSYAFESISNSFVDIETWLSGINTGERTFVGCYFNSTREDSYEILQSLQVKAAGEQKLSPFPHWTLSTRTANKRFNFVSLPLSDWYTDDSKMAHSLDIFGGSHDTNSVHQAVDRYYNLGALINIYSHSLSDAETTTGGLVREYIRYSMDTNTHPRVWSANSQMIYDWWVQRSNAQISVTHSTNAFETLTTVNVSGATDPDTAIEILLPSTNSFSGIEVMTNGVAAWGDAYRVKGRTIKVRVGTSINTVQIRLLTGGDFLFSDNFTRDSYPAPVSPWVIYNNNWTIDGGTMDGGANPDNTYGIVHYNSSFGTWNDYAVEAKVQFPAGAYGGGIGGRLNPATGERYAAWIFPEDSSGGSNVLRLLKFSAWQTFGYDGVNQDPIAQVNLPSVGTGWHTLKLAFRTNEIAVYLDGSQLIAATDIEATPLLNGGISLDMYTETNGYTMSVDDVIVRPLVAGDSYQVQANTVLTVPASGVLTNDTLLGSGPHTATLSSPPVHGSVSVNSNGGFTYTPSTNFTGSDSFIYTASDAQGAVGSGTVSITVLGTHNGPVLPAQTNRTVTELTALVINNTAIDTDLPPPVLTYTLLSGPTNAVVSANGVITWTPTEAQGPGTNVFTTWVVDDVIPPLSATNTFTVIVTESNSAPVLPAQSNRFVGKLLTMTVTNTATDSDVPPNALTYTLTSSPTNASISASGVITWTPTEEQDLTTNVFTTVVTDDGTPVRSATNSFTVIVESTPVVTLNSTALLVETCPPTNNAYDPGETITMQFSLKNTGRGATANLVATLLETNGVVAPSGPQTFGIIPAEGGIISMPFTFAITGSCGGSFTARLKLQDGAVNLGTVSATFPLGWSGSVLTQNFDSVTAPALPSGWITTNSGAQPLWVTQTTVRDTLPNAAYSTTAAAVGVNELRTPNIMLPGASAQLTFRHQFSFESQNATVGYDGGVLEISIGTNAFTDIVTSGGSFVSGGYNSTISGSFANPLASRAAWSGTNGGFSNVVVNLPASSLGQSIRLRWRCGTDNGGISGAGWRVDTVSVTGSGCCQNSAPVLPIQNNRTVVELATLTVTNTAVDTGIPASALSYQLLNPPSGATISTNGIISWTPAENQGPGTNILTTVVTYNGAPPLNTTNSFQVVVTETNAAPVLPVQGDLTIAELNALTVTNTATDSDLPANALTYSLITAPVGAAISASGIITWSPGEAEGPSVNTFTTVVTDNGSPSRSATNSFTVTVTELNVAPALPPQNNLTIAELTPLVVTNTASDADVPANTLSYSLVNPPAGALISAAGVITWTPTEAQGPATNVFTTVVVDNGLPVLGSTNSFTVVVQEINVAPILPAQTNITSSGLATITVTNTATDSDLPENTLSYELLNAPSGMLISTNGIITWTPTTGQVPGTNTITTVVTDTNAAAVSAQSLSTTNTFVITVNAIHDGPELPAQANLTITEIQALVVTNAASVHDVPPLALTYGLLSAPAGASIDTNGVITWSPTESQGPGNYTFTTVVVDDGTPHLSDANTFTVRVDEWNNPPTLPAQSDRTSVGTATITVTNTATDTDLPANTISYSFIDAPAGAGISADGIITWTPSLAQVPGTNTFTTVASDSSPTAVNSTSLSATNSFIIIIQPLRSAPVFGSQTNLAINEGALLIVTNIATDANIPALGLDYALLNPPSGAVIDTNGVITWTPSESQGPSTNLFTTIATDRGIPALSSTNNFTVIVNEVNESPILPAQPDLSVPELSQIIVTNTATDTDAPANTLAYSLVSAPAGVTIDSTGVIQWLPTESQGPGTNLIVTVVTDNGTPPLSATNQFTVIVTEVNSAPSLPSQTNLTVAELISLSITNTASDSDNPANSLNYLLLTAPSGANINANGVISWTPAEADGPGTNIFTTVVTDDGFPALSVTNTFTVVVTEANTTPVLPAIAQQEISELSTLTVTNTAIDLDQPANTLAYMLLNAPSGATVNASGVISWTPTEAQGPSTNSFVTVVTDDGSPASSATNQFIVIVHEVNDAPTLPTQADRNLTGAESLTVTNTASDTDDPANSISYQLVNPPVGATIDSNGIIHWTPAQAQIPSTNVFTTIATDSNPPAAQPSLSATNHFTVVVNAIHNGPALPTIEGQTVSENTTLVVTNTATQDNIPALGLTYVLVNPPAGATIDTNGVISWTPGESQGPASHTLTTIVTDNGVPPLSATNAINVMVQEINTAPVLPAQANRDLTGYQQLIVTNAATDADAPANSLTYQLTQSPAGAAISAAGVITWLPTAAQIPASYLFETVVTDSNPSAINSQQLSATNQFTVTTHTVHNGPSLPSQSARTIGELTTMIVTNTAINNDVPATILTYSLVNPPAGATVDSNGIITWTPTESQGGTTNTITTLVMDNGDPVKYALNSFTVIVSEVNSAPVLSAQTNRTILELTTLVVTNTATDSDLPSNSLTYALMNPPAGATINSSGVINWTPSAAQAPSTNSIITVVTDNGSPALSTTNTFTVVVTKPLDMTPPTIQAITVSNNIAVITWSSLPGRIYRVQYKQDLSNTNWSDLPSDVAATGSTASKTDTIGNNPRRFYRVVMMGSAAVPPPHPPLNLAISASNGITTLSWNSVAGRSYKVDYKLDLMDTLWTTLPPTITATGSTATTTDITTGQPQRFYRVEPLD